MTRISRILQDQMHCRRFGVSKLVHYTATITTPSAACKCQLCVYVCVDVTIRTADHAAKISTFAKVKGSVYYLLRVLSNTAAIFIYVYIYIYIYIYSLDF